MKILAATMAGLFVLCPFAAGASQGEESPIAIAFVDAHSPRTLLDEARHLNDDINSERAKRGLAPLVRDAALDRFAYEKAADMARRGYFGHTNPDGVTFAERLRGLHWPTNYAAENIAFDRDEPHAHAAFMNSPPHCSNLLDPHERRLGVAVVTVGDGETFYVEDFSA
ncbi:MAG: CAP domain-containing protein [Candidatus Eremiobacteraeota bacterium]|nr:CAP domain-containing protein [Candidatus Eremiobacteraeota bacterium]